MSYEDYDDVASTRTLGNIKFSFSNLSVLHGSLGNITKYLIVKPESEVPKSKVKADPGIDYRRERTSSLWEGLNVK